MTVPDGDNLVVSVFHSVSASKIWNVRGVAFDGNDLNNEGGLCTSIY